MILWVIGGIVCGESLKGSVVEVVELAYTTDLKSVAHYGLAGSSPAFDTILKTNIY